MTPFKADIIILAFAAAAAAGERFQDSDPPTEERASSLRIVTFNIRYDNPGDGEYAWSNRKDRVVELIESFDADIIGLQEVLSGQYAFLREHLGEEYTLRGVGRNDGADTETSGEASPIAYRTERFEELDFGTWWLSETPDKPGSRGWDAALPRIATWVRLADRDNGGRPLLVVCTHFDHRGETARAKSAELLAAKLADEPHVVLLGDFNAAPGSVPHTTLTAAFEDAAGDDERPTWCGWDGEPDPGRRIDWILLKGRGFAVRAYDVPPRRDPTRPESDHLPVVAEIEFADKP